ncbi:MAG: hypothetical protein AAFN77_16100 [Planctomycetota bacterium]
MTANPQEIIGQLESHRVEVSNALDRLAKDWPNPVRIRVKRIARWFRGQSNLADYPQETDRLIVVNELILQSQGRQTESTSEPPKLDSFAIVNALERATTLIARDGGESRRRLILLSYPILLMAATCIGWILFSFFVCPVFEDYFNEFGIRLPTMTKLTISLCAWIRQGLWILLALMSFILIASIIQELFPRGFRHRFGLGTLLNSRFTRAIPWIQHLKGLLASGHSAKESLTTTSRVYGISLANALGVSPAPADGPTSGNLVDTRPNSHFPVVKRAITQPDVAMAIEFLDATIVRYRQLGRQADEWWIQLFASWMSFGAIGFFCIASYSMFAPVLSIITGLSGF